MLILVPIGKAEADHGPDGPAFPKPLWDIRGQPMIAHVVKSLGGGRADRRFIFVADVGACRKYSLDGVLRHVAGTPQIVKLASPTEGAVCSCMMAVDLIDKDEELLIANSDHVFLDGIDGLIRDLRGSACSAGVATFQSVHPRYSFVRTDVSGRVYEAAEKRVISRNAVAGIYYFRRAGDFLDAAAKVVLNDAREQGSFYLSQVLNEIILSGGIVQTAVIAKDRVATLYTPAKAEEYAGYLAAREQIPPVLPTLMIPMAGDGRRFLDAGYTLPKPFIDVRGKPMIGRVLDNLRSSSFRTVTVVRSSHLTDPVQHKLLSSMVSSVISIPHLSGGPACTVMAARREIDMETPLIIANCDQIVDYDITRLTDRMEHESLDGIILVFREPMKDPKWSYVRVGADGLAAEVKEKLAVSDLATVGIYAFAKARYFFDAATDMVAADDRTNGEFYVCPVYAYMIMDGMKVGIEEIPSAAMHGIGTPLDLAAYSHSLLCDGAAR